MTDAILHEWTSFGDHTKVCKRCRCTRLQDVTGYLYALKDSRVWDEAEPPCQQYDHGWTTEIETSQGKTHICHKCRAVRREHPTRNHYVYTAVGAAEWSDVEPVCRPLSHEWTQEIPFGDPEDSLDNPQGTIATCRRCQVKRMTQGDEFVYSKQGQHFGVVEPPCSPPFEAEAPPRGVRPIDDRGARIELRFECPYCGAACQVVTIKQEAGQRFGNMTVYHRGPEPCREIALGGQALLTHAALKAAVHQMGGILASKSPGF